MRLVVTGAGGGLARAFLAQVPAHHEVHAFDHAALDVGDHDAVRQAVEPLRPDAIVNLAAFTQVDANETDPARAARDNAIGPQNLALAARACGAVLLHISTDFVFDGAKGAPYDELDAPAPTLRRTVGRSWRGSGTCATSCPRTSSCASATSSAAGPTTSRRPRERWPRASPPAASPIGSARPRTSHDLAERLLPLLLTGRFGTYHLAGPEPASWFDVVTARARDGGAHRARCGPRPRRRLGLAAPRPAYSALTSVYVRELGPGAHAAARRRPHAVPRRAPRRP